jgi:Planctomycete cytochrome C
MKQWYAMAAAISWAVSWPASAQTKVDFAKDIQPLLQHTCVKCHGAEKQKGKLRLDSKEAAFKGGKNGPVLMPGAADKSEVYRRITLPKGHDDVMPNEGDPLTTAQTDLFRDWINQGAVWPDDVAVKETAPTPALSSGPVLPADFKPGAAETKAIATLAQHGVDVRPIAMNSVWREANFRLQGTSVTDTVIVPLKDLASLVELNLGTTKVTDAGLSNVRGLTNLQRLHLELTSITDSGLDHVKGLTNLTYLNLYGTPVTDAGLSQLKGMHYLRHLYVWQTKVTEAGAKSLKEALPNLDVSTGWDLTALAKKEEKKEDKAADEKKEEKKDEKKADKKDDKDADKKDEKKAEKKEDKKDAQKEEKK